MQTKLTSILDDIPNTVVTVVDAKLEMLDAWCKSQEQAFSQHQEYWETNATNLLQDPRQKLSNIMQKYVEELETE